MVRVRVRKRRRRRSKAKVALAIGGGVLVLLLLAAGWLAYSGYRAHQHLVAVQDEIGSLQAHVASGDIAAAQTDAHEIVADADAADGDTTGPVWWGASALPWLGRPLDTARAVTSSLALVADHALPAVLNATDHLTASHLRTSDGRIDLPAIERLGPALDRAGVTMTTAIRRMQASPASTWWGSVDAARQQIIDKLVPLRETVGSVGQAVRLVPPLLGADGPKTYMVTFENEAELRPTGGLPGAFAILRADDGKLTFTQFEPDNYLIGARASGLHFGAGYNVLFDGSFTDYRDSNQSPHFPYAAQIWASMWHDKTGQTLDGALAIDPTALSYLLEATGPVPLPDGTEVTAGNVVALTQQTIYAKFPGVGQNDQRKQYLVNIAAAVSKALLNPGVDPGALIRGAQRAVAEHRLLLWTSDTKVESTLSKLTIGGVVPETKSPYVALFLQEFSQSKLDYYVFADMDYRRTGCGSSRHVVATVTLRNEAPANLPPYVVGNSFPPGNEEILVGLYGSVGGHFTSVRLNGHEPFALTARDRGHPVFIADITVPRGQSRTLIFQLKEPPVDGPVTVRAQPMVHPATVSVHEESCH